MEQTNQKIVKALRFSSSLKTLKEIEDSIPSSVKYTGYYLVMIVSAIQRFECGNSLLGYFISSVVTAVAMLPVLCLSLRECGESDNSENARNNPKEGPRLNPVLLRAWANFTWGRNPAEVVQNCPSQIPAHYHTLLFYVLMIINLILPVALHFCFKYCLNTERGYACFKYCLSTKSVNTCLKYCLKTERCKMKAINKLRVYACRLVSPRSTFDIESQQMINDDLVVLEVEEQNVFLRYLKRFIRNRSMGNTFVSECPMDTKCRICLKAYESGELIRVTDCGCEYHKSCIDLRSEINPTFSPCIFHIYKDSSKDFSKSR